MPATVLVAWALTGVFVPLLTTSRRWMSFVAIGDAFYALNMAAAITVHGDWTFQLGEFLTIGGALGLLVLWTLFTIPFIASPAWASSKIRLGGPPPTVVAREGDNSSGESNDTSGEGNARFSATVPGRVA